MYKKKKCYWKKIIAFFLFVFTFDQVGYTQNLQPKPDKLIIDSNTLEIDQKQELAIFKGAVKASQQDFSLRADLLNVFYKKQPKSTPDKKLEKKSQPLETAIQKMEAIGHVEIIRNGQIIQGDQAIFTPEKDAVIITGDDLRYQDGKNIVTACRLTFNRHLQKTILESCATQKKPVTLQITP